MSRLCSLIIASCLMTVGTAYAAEPTALAVTLSGLDSNGRILAKHAYCQPDKIKHSVDGGNVSPRIDWSKGPEGTRSYAIIAHDPDVPVRLHDANTEGMTIAAGLPREEFIHWVLVDIPASHLGLPEGADSQKVEKGKPAEKTAYGLRGINDYGKFFGGTYAGYDGPCPPWNDEKLHHYVFTVYALDVPTLGLTGPFTAEEARKAMQGHILAQGKAVGTYSQFQGGVK